jgi:ABC-2 type transport system ATP-binding protein
MNMSAAIQITGLEKHYNEFALGPLDLTVPTGTIYGLIGPNGAGKTTLIDQIFGMGIPDAGSIRVCGLDHERDEVAMKQHAAYVGPDLSFVVWRKVSKAIRFVRGFRPTWDDAYASHLMQRLGLNAGDRISTLSFGGRMKLSLLLALAWRPQVLVLDEPTTGLDAHSKQAIFSELLAMVKDESRCVLISSHQIADLERYADRIGVLHQGRMLVEGVTGELMEQHVQVEFESDQADAVAKLPGLTIIEHNGLRWRAVLNISASSLSSLEASGARSLRAQPMTLEELFLALTK